MNEPQDNCYGEAQLPAGGLDSLKNRLSDLRRKRRDTDNRDSKRQQLTRVQRAEILAKTGSRCHICGGRIAPNSYWEADHVFPAAARPF